LNIVFRYSNLCNDVSMEVDFYFLCVCVPALEVGVRAWLQKML
jgi:hypothetical protein